MMSELLKDLKEGIDYEWVDLPSRGEPYPHKKHRVPIRYMTAQDEDLIYSDSPLLIGVRLAKSCILDNEVNVEELCIGDVDAIALALYRNAYPQDAEERTSGWHNSEYLLLSDENCLYDYILPDKSKLKYHLPTYKDMNILKKNNTPDVMLDFISNIFVSHDDKPLTIENIQKMDSELIDKISRFIYFVEPSVVNSEGERVVVNTLFYTTKI